MHSAQPVCLPVRCAAICVAIVRVTQGDQVSLQWFLFSNSSRAQQTGAWAEVSAVGMLTDTAPSTYCCGEGRTAPGRQSGRPIDELRAAAARGEPGIAYNYPAYDFADAIGRRVTYTF